jgi:Putative Ig domain
VNIRFNSVLLIALTGVALSGCFDFSRQSTTSGAAGDATAQQVPEVAPPSTSTMPPSAQALNAIPQISGSAATQVMAGTRYTFQPRATDSDGDVLHFQATGLPSWASINTDTGLVSGTPRESDVGESGDIRIWVTDSKNDGVLPTFRIMVTTAAAASTGSATVSWTAPVENSDGSAVTNLSGYRIYYGNSANSLGSMVQVSNPGITTYVVNSLRSGTWFFAVSAYNAAGAESDRSTIGSKAIP